MQHTHHHNQDEIMALEIIEASSIKKSFLTYTEITCEVLVLSSLSPYPNPLLPVDHELISVSGFCQFEMGALFPWEKRPLVSPIYYSIPTMYNVSTIFF